MMFRSARVAAAMAAVFALVVVSVAMPRPEPSAAAGTLSRLEWQGQAWNFAGVNVAWYNWACDFGCGSSGGVSDPSVRSAIGQRFAELQKYGIHAVRWWMFQEPWQITRDSSGKPTGIDPRVYQDIDAALALAEQYDLYYNFVLFEFPTKLPNSWITNETHRQALADVLAPLFARYRGNPRIFAWEIFNEPEWDIWNGRVPEAATVDLGRRIAAAIHANSTAYATVGHAMVDGIPMWTSANLDFYQPHWYDYMQPGGWCAFCRTADDVRAQYNVSKPIIIGEFYAGADVGAQARYQRWYDLGYAGAWAWSLFYDRTYDRMQIDLAGVGAFTAFIGDAGPRSAGASSPPPTTTPTQQPTPEPTPAPTQEPSPPPAHDPTPSPTAAPAPTEEPQPEPTPAPAPAYTSASASFEVAAGGTATIYADVKSTVAVNALVDIEVYSATGQKVHQAWWDNQPLPANQTKRYTASWAVPATLPAGTYTVMVGIFEPGWAKNVHWNASAGTVTVAAPQPTPAPEPTPEPDPTETSFVTSARATNTKAGSSTSIRAYVTASATTRVLVDIEVYDANGKRVYQRWYDNQSLSADYQKTFRTSWRTPRSLPAGTYTVKIGIFSPGWQELLEWNDRAATFTVSR